MMQKSTHPPAAVMTVEEAAAKLRIGRSAAYAAVKSGEIPTIKLGRLLRVPVAELERMLGERGAA